MVGPKDLPAVARKMGGLLGKGVGFVGRTRTNLQSFIKEHELTDVQQDFERSLLQIRQVQDEVKQGLSSPIAQTIHRHVHSRHAYFTPYSPSSTNPLTKKVESPSPNGEYSHAMKNTRAFNLSASETPIAQVVNFGPPSPEALAWKSTSADMTSGGADYLLAYASMRALQQRIPGSTQSSHDSHSRPATFGQSVPTPSVVS